MITAALFVFSAVAHHAVAAATGTESGMTTPGVAHGMASNDMASNDMASNDMASHDMASHDGMPCPSSSDCNNDMSMQAMACFAHCAAVVGVLADWVVGSAATIAHPMQLPVTPPLTSLHGPPEPHPPRS